jgi:hypothetical protein
MNRRASNFDWSSSRSLVLVWLLAVLVIWVLATYIGKNIPPAIEGFGFPRTPVEVLSTWDGAHYANIASRGYIVENEARRQLAFFPLLPAVARLIGGSTHARLAGILLSQACLLGSMILLSNLAHGKRQVPLRLQPGYWLLISPLGFFFSVYYTESLFLFLTLAYIVAYRRKRLEIAIIAGTLAGLTRATAVCLPALLFWDALYKLQRRERCLGTLMCAAAPWVGIALYVSFVGYVDGDPLAYLNIQAEYGWKHSWTFPFAPLLRSFMGFSIDLLGAQIRPAHQILRLVSSTTILVLIVWGWRREDPAFIFYLIVSMIFIHSQELARSTARYELVLFPAFLLLTQTLVTRPRIASIVSGILILTQLKFFVDHISWRWAA